MQLRIDEDFPADPRLLTLTHTLRKGKDYALGVIVGLWLFCVKQRSSVLPEWIKINRTELDAVVAAGFAEIQNGRYRFPDLDAQIELSRRNKRNISQRWQPDTNVKRSYYERIPEKRTVKTDSKNERIYERSSARITNVSPIPEFSAFDAGVKTALQRISSAVQGKWLTLYGEDPGTQWIEREILKAMTWLDNHPRKQPKSDRGMSAFLTGWLNRGFEFRRRTGKAEERSWEDLAREDGTL